MNQRKLAYIIISMVTVATFAMLMLNNLFAEVPKSHKVLIVISATLFSGILANGLYPKEHPDEKETGQDKQK